MESESTLRLPPGEELELDFQYLEELILKATCQTLDLLKAIEVRKGIRLIFNGDEMSQSASYVAFPDYRDRTVQDQIERIWNNSEVLNLTNYLWEKRTPKYTFAGSHPNYLSWAREVFADFIHTPLLKALELAGISEAIDGKNINSWVISNKDLHSVISNYIDRFQDIKKNKYQIKAFCPLHGIKLSKDETLVLTQNIKLRNWSQKERAIFLSLYHQEYLWDDFKSPLSTSCLAEIVLSVSRDNDVLAQATECLDLLKWGLTVAVEQHLALSEGTCIIVDRTGGLTGKFRRDETSEFPITYLDTGIQFGGSVSRTNSGLSEISLQRNQVEACQTALKHLLECVKNNPKSESKFYRVLWHLSRSYTSVLSRDGLLEAAIGIDTLVVPGGGDSRYKFCLHGSAMLATLNNQRSLYENPFKLLSEIYDQRSSAAHGSSGKVDHNLSIEARKVLANILLAITNLGLIKQLDLQHKEVPKAVQEFVIEKATC